MLKNGYFYLVLGVVFFVVWKMLPEASAPESGPLPEPVQSKPMKKPWGDGDWHFTPLAKYKGRVRILSRKNYWLGKDTEIAPTDLVFAWGPLAVVTNYQKLSVSQSGRWFFTQYSEPLNIGDLDAMVANVHMIPGYPSVRKTLKKVRRGDLVDFEGYLVEVNHPAMSGPWTSSLSRYDTGAGACEILYVTDLSIRPR